MKTVVGGRWTYTEPFPGEKLAKEKKTSLMLGSDLIAARERLCKAIRNASVENFQRKKINVAAYNLAVKVI